MKTLIIILLSLTVQVSFGQVVEPSEDLLNQDLNYKQTEETEAQDRDVASDETKSDSDESREVASEEDQNDKIQYWKY